MISRSGLATIASTFRHRNFALFMWGMTPSLVTLWMQRLAVGWLAWNLTHSPTWLGLIAFADLFPTMVLSPFAGAMMDRINPLKPNLWTQVIILIQAVALCILTYSDLITIEILFALGFMLGINQPFMTMARHTVIPMLVPRHALGSAIAIDSVLYNAARFIGPAIAGVVILAGVGWVFAINALAYAGFIVALLFIDAKPPERDRSARRSLMADIREGWHYTAAHPGIGPLLVLLVVSSIASRPVADLLPGFADAVFDRGPVGLSLLAAAMGIGAMAAAFWLAQRGAVAGLTAIAVLGTLAMAAALGAFTLSDNLWVALPFLVLVGVAMNLTSTSTQTLIQSAVDGAMRGRVMSFFTMVYRGAPALGALFMGWVAEWAGLQNAVAGGAVACLLIWGWAVRKRRTMALALESRGGG